MIIILWIQIKTIYTKGIHIKYINYCDYKSTITKKLLKNDQLFLVTCVGYDIYPIRQYVYFQNNRIRYVLDTWYMNTENCKIIIKNIINIRLLFCESKLKLYILKLSTKEI